MRRTYRAWVEAGARGFWTGDYLTVVSTEVVAPDAFLSGLLPGYIARQTASDPATDGPRGQFGLLHTGRVAEEWIAEPGMAVEWGWLTWQTVGDVVDGIDRPPSGAGEAGGEEAQP